MARTDGTGRIGWIDAARAAGAVAIVLLHVLVSTNLAADLSRARRIAYAIVGIVGCRWAVPAFFMVSGALMLNPARSMDWHKVLLHVRRMLLVIATFGTAFALMEEVWTRMRGGMEMGPSLVFIVIRDVLTMRTWDHLWFVYAMAGVYLFVPAMRWVGRKYGERGHMVLTLLLFVGVLVVPTLMGGAPVAGVISAFVWNVGAGCACFCVGACLTRWQLSPAWAAVGIGSAIVMVLVSITGIGAGEGDRGFVFLQGSCFACAYAVFVLLLLRRFVGEEPLRMDSVPNALARDSFGIYLIHPLFIHLGLMLVDPVALLPVLYEGVFAGLALLASVFTTRLLRRVPLLGSLL